ncbi:MAG: 3-(3-hydroxy-phenyl)propionate hydroxylase [Halioglobus sp.]|jgi:3-(3-hydroxy-phenyl)propionate hydroxylase
MTTTPQKQYDVVISGAGPCGVTLANMLGNYGVPTLLIDLEPDVLNLPRAVGMCDEGSRILDSVGIFEYSPIDLLDIEKIYFADKHATPIFHFDTSKKINNFCMQRTFYQPKLEHSLRNALERFDCVDFWPSTELINFKDDGAGVTISLQREGVEKTIPSRFLVGSDGSKSPIRKQLDIGFRGKTYHQDWLIIDIANNPIPSNDVYFSIDPSRPGITLPLPLGRRRWEFVVKEGDTAEALYSDAMLERLLSPWGDYKLMEVERKAIYTFHARVANQYSKGNVFLAGDAAHITPPFAGQGMMAGFRDAHNLSWKLAGVLNNTLSPSILESYDTERIPHSKQVINFAKFVGSIVLPQSKVKAWIRDSLINFSAMIGLYTVEEGARMERIPNHVNGSTLRNLLISKIRGTGQWFPQHMLSLGGETKPSDDWLKPGFHIVSWKNDANSIISETTRKRWASLGGEFSTITNSPDSHALVDQTGEYETYFGAKTIVVLRPDKIVAVRCREKDLDSQLNKYLDKICAPSAAAA